MRSLTIHVADVKGDHLHRFIQGGRFAFKQGSSPLLVTHQRGRLICHAGTSEGGQEALDDMLCHELASLPGLTTDGRIVSQPLLTEAPQSSFIRGRFTQTQSGISFQYGDSRTDLDLIGIEQQIDQIILFEVSHLSGLAIGIGFSDQRIHILIATLIVLHPSSQRTFIPLAAQCIQLRQHYLLIILQCYALLLLDLGFTFIQAS
ncbi:hypothetical protein DSECCO2_566820 [anaerobic digester metagenome]